MSWFLVLLRFALAGVLCVVAAFDPAPTEVRLAALLVFGLRPEIVIVSLLLTVSVLELVLFFGVAEGETAVLALAASVRKTNSAAKIAATTAPITKNFLSYDPPYRLPSIDPLDL